MSIIDKLKYLEQHEEVLDKMIDTHEKQFMEMGIYYELWSVLEAMKQVRL